MPSNVSLFNFYAIMKKLNFTQVQELEKDRNVSSIELYHVPRSNEYFIDFYVNRVKYQNYITQEAYNKYIDFERKGDDLNRIIVK